MCGIIAYTGKRDDAPKIVIRGLKMLEYRGYDSWGVGYIGLNSSFAATVKRVGSIGYLKNIDPDIAKLMRAKAYVAIGQTRWATTGKVSKINAHPHLSQSGKIMLVQNGIVENFTELKKQLIHSGFHFKSETDTEVIVNLIEYEFSKQKSKQKSFKNAVRSAFLGLKGRNAIVAIFEETGEMIAARLGSPLIIGVAGKEEYFIASDIPAFSEYTDRVIYLDDGQMAVVGERAAMGSKNTDGSIAFYDIKTGAKINRRIVRVVMKLETTDKGKYKYLMLKEIMEQKETLRSAVHQDDKEIMQIAEMINKAYGTFAVGCGGAGYASMIGEYLFAKVARKHINFVLASEFGSHEPFLTSRTLMLITSQSGETADVLEAMEAGLRKKARIVSLVNVRESSIAKKSHHALYLNVGPEKAVASTKATTAHIALHILLAYAAAGRLVEGKQLLINAAGQVNDMLNPRYEEHLKKLAKKLYKVQDIYVLGRGLMYPSALEIALKIKEVSYIHADGMQGGELKHGTLALIEKGTPCIVVVANDQNKHSILSNAEEVKARGGYIIGIAPEHEPVFDYYIRVPDAGDAAPIVSIIPGQILAYHLALLKKLDPDKPRNLAKSVTVK